MYAQWVVNDPATLNVFWIVMSLFTDASTVALVPPNVTCNPELAVAATPPEMNTPSPIQVELTPGAPIVRNTSVNRRYHGPDSDDAGTVCAIDAPNATPALVP